MRARRWKRRRSIGSALVFALVLIGMACWGLVATHSARLRGPFIGFAGFTAVGVLQVCGQVLAARRKTPRPRWQYFLFCLSWIAVSVAGGVTATWASSHHRHWVTTAMIVIVGIGGAGALVTFGRGAFRGRLRRAFWRYPPPWLNEDTPAVIAEPPSDQPHAAVNTDSRAHNSCST